MKSRSGRYVICYNGEVYNGREMGAQLSALGASFRGHSDTEVMLAAIETWGLDDAIDRFVGMFAFALWDREQRVLHLVRDRLGIKPLFYGWVGDCLVFGSELKAIRAFGSSLTINRDAIALQMRHSYVPAPWSIYEGVYKLLPGTHIAIPESSVAADLCPWTAEGGEVSAVQPRTFWSASEVFRRGAEQPFRGDEAAAQVEVERLVEQAVAERLVSDVPLGAFLSGGIDSSVVVAAMVRASSTKVRTFSIGFQEERFNEATYAKAVAKHLGTDHTELYVDPSDVLGLLPTLGHFYDEPFSDASQLPTMMLCKMTREYVTVGLSGDGGDEVFCGYNRYDVAPAIWRRIRLLPVPARRAAQRALTAIPIPLWDRLYRRMGRLLPQRLTNRQPGVIIEKIAGTVGAVDEDAVYRFLISGWKNPEALVLGSREPHSLMMHPQLRSGDSSFVRRMMVGDMQCYLPDDILVKVDRASMAVSLETRVPLIDHRIIEFAATLPTHFLHRDGKSKLPLRRMLAKHVPRELFERPKKGFGAPISNWLRGPLRDWAEDLLARQRLGQEGWLDADIVRGVWKAHLSGERDFGRRLWDVLMFQAWLERS